jgi:hypothetical protein
MKTSNRPSRVVNATDELRVLRLQIRVNEMLPPALRDDDFVKMLKAKLAAARHRRRRLGAA